MVAVLKPVFVVTAWIAVAVLLAGCEEMMPDDFSSGSYVGSYVATGRSTEATLHVSRDRFTMVVVTGAPGSRVAGRRAAAIAGPAWNTIDGTVDSEGGSVTLRSVECTVRVDTGRDFARAAVGELLDCLGVSDEVTVSDRTDPQELIIGRWYVTVLGGDDTAADEEWEWTFRRSGPVTVTHFRHGARDDVAILSYDIRVELRDAVFVLNEIIGGYAETRTAFRVPFDQATIDDLNARLHSVGTEIYYIVTTSKMIWRVASALGGEQTGPPYTRLVRGSCG